MKKETKAKVKRKVAGIKSGKVTAAKKVAAVGPKVARRKAAASMENEPELLHVPNLCRCGCGKNVKVTRGHRPRKFFNGACRVRFLRARKATAGLVKRAPWKAGRRGTKAAA